MGSLLKDEVAVVTGAAQGNGRAIALGMARAGAKVAVADVNRDAWKRSRRKSRHWEAPPCRSRLTLRTGTRARALSKWSKTGSDLPQSWLTMRASSAARLSMLLPTMRIAN